VCVCVCVLYYCLFFGFFAILCVCLCVCVLTCIVLLYYCVIIAKKKPLHFASRQGHVRVVRALLGHLVNGMNEEENDHRNSNNNHNNNNNNNKANVIHTQKESILSVPNTQDDLVDMFKSKLRQRNTHNHIDNYRSTNINIKHTNTKRTNSNNNANTKRNNEQRQRWREVNNNANNSTINCCTKRKWTALMLACDRGHRNVVELLLQYGADASLRNKVCAYCVCMRCVCCVTVRSSGVCICVR